MKYYMIFIKIFVVIGAIVDVMLIIRAFKKNEELEKAIKEAEEAQTKCYEACEALYRQGGYDI